MLAANRLKGESDRGAKVKKKQKDEKQPSTSNLQILDDKIEDMSKMTKRFDIKTSKVRNGGEERCKSCSRRG